MEEMQLVDSSDSRPDEQIEQTTQPFVGRWNHLVSTTNWEKGQIILQWREALVADGADAREYSDDAWSRRVGGITAQHAGRLRRVAQRFGSSYKQFEGLYWSHFQAAIDWDDAEMWLEGAVRNGWSVSAMRSTRWETLGSLPDQEPLDVDIVSGEIDEDFEPAVREDPGQEQAPGEFSEETAGPRHEGPDFGDEDPASMERAAASSDEQLADDAEQEPVEFIQPFADLADLPDDLSEAFDAFKLAILRHKGEGWTQISCDDCLGTLEALKQLALAPSA